MATVEFSMKGVNEYISRLVELREDVGKKTIYSMASAGARVVRDAAKANAEAVGLRESGDLIRNITIARGKTFDPPIVAYDVGVRSGRVKQKRENNDPFYWFMWEFGHHNIFTRRFERRPFLVPAIEGNKVQSLAAMEKVAARAVRRIEAKAK